MLATRRSWYERAPLERQFLIAAGKNSQRFTRADKRLWARYYALTLSFAVLSHYLQRFLYESAYGKKGSSPPDESDH